MEQVQTFWQQAISQEIFQKKYNLYEETETEVFRNIAKEIASPEKEEVRKYWEETFFNLISSTQFIPAGRILANARPFSKLKNYNNCFTIDIQDDMSMIYEALKEDAQISKMGGGVGFNVSKLRPEGDILSRGGEASGPLSFLKVFNESAKIIMTGGSRRCLPKTYKIQMFDKTWKQINEIEVGEYINFEGKKYKITDFFDNGVQGLIKIKTKKGYHISTPNHKWYVMNFETNKPEWVEAQDLYDGKIKFGFLIPKNK